MQFTVYLVNKGARLTDSSKQLKRMMDDKAEFRGVQEAAIEAITAGESPVVAVMPTGAVKSLLFMLPAFAEQGGTTIVVVPLIALRSDMKQRCKKLGISCVEWESRHPPDAAAVVLVTPESAVGEAFATFLNRLQAMRQLDRIVIDECHIGLNRQYTFRKQMQQLGRLVAAETHIVILTATLPPSEEGELFRRMHVDPEQVNMFRAPTARINVAYRVVKVCKEAKRQEVEATVLAMVRRKLRKYKAGKVVVYGNSVPKVKALAEKLGCQAYHRAAVGKAGMLEAFTAGRQRIISSSASCPRQTSHLSSPSLHRARSTSRLSKYPSNTTRLHRAAPLSPTYDCTNACSASSCLSLAARWSPSCTIMMASLGNPSRPALPLSCA
jgi:superfamily II DNA helicase RecQ